MNWCFAIVNSKLAEIFFEKDKEGTVKFLGHCYVKESEYKTEKEKRWIKQDIVKARFICKNGEYKKIAPKLS